MDTDEKLQEVDDNYKRTHVKKFYKEIGKTMVINWNKILICKKNDGSLVVIQRERLKRWTEYQAELNEKYEEELTEGQDEFNKPDKDGI